MQRTASTAASMTARPALGELSQNQQLGQPPPGFGMRKAPSQQQRDKAKVSRVSYVPNRADRKSQVRQCSGFCTADFLSSLAYQSAEQNPKHYLT